MVGYIVAMESRGQEERVQSVLDVGLSEYRAYGERGEGGGEEGGEDVGHQRHLD